MDRPVSAPKIDSAGHDLHNGDNDESNDTNHDNKLPNAGPDGFWAPAVVVGTHPEGCYDVQLLTHSGRGCEALESRLRVALSEFLDRGLTSECIETALVRLGARVPCCHLPC